MAPRARNDEFAVPVVKLKDPNGNIHHESTTVGVNNLVYGGHGYTVVDFDSVAEALDFLIDSGGVKAAPQTVEEAVAAPPVPSGDKH